MSDMRLVVVGAAGRMGRIIVRLIEETEGTTLSGALEQTGSVALGEDAGLIAGCQHRGVRVTDTSYLDVGNRAEFENATARWSCTPPSRRSRTKPPALPSSSPDLRWRRCGCGWSGGGAAL